MWHEHCYCRCGTWGYGLLVALAVLGEQLDARVSEGFSNPKYSMIIQIICSLRDTFCTQDDISFPAAVNIRFCAGDSPQLRFACLFCTLVARDS